MKSKNPSIGCTIADAIHFCVIIASIFGVLYHLKFAKAIFFGREENGAIQIDTNLLGLIAIVAIHIFTLLVYE